jgi:hypothetical protein
MFHPEFQFVLIRFYKKKKQFLKLCVWWQLHAVKSLPSDILPERQLIQVAFLLAPYINLYRNDFPSREFEGTCAALLRVHVLKASTDKRRESSTRWWWNGRREWKEANFSPSLPICYKEIFPENSLLRDDWHVSFIHVIEKGIKLRYFLFITSTTLPASFCRLSS